ncbi:hypothetical protein AB0P21_39390 [Kribbella sp. NPDC056861]|uniref:hypothetical protein n=1 Tax=Kribbella sp. NPDC056861 TaxID=3154857 RepID=UPI00343CCA1A
MRERLVTMPTWALFLITTLAFLLPMIIAGFFGDLLTRAGLIFFVAFSLVFGAIMTLTLKRRFRRERRAVGDVPPAVENAAHKAVMRGPVPTDPEIRAATLKLAEHQLQMMIKWRPLVIIGFTIAAVATVASVIAASEAPWRLLVIACYVPLMLAQWYGPKKLRRRIQELAEPQGT